MGNNIEIPYSGRIHLGIEIGTDVVITGRVPVDCNMFSINLCKGPTYDQDCHLHFNPRLDDNRVVRNHIQGGNWGSEETDGGCPFIKGHNFEIHMKAHHKGFHITVNNRRFCEWTNRLPRETIQYIYIEGKVIVSYINFSVQPSEIPSKPIEIPYSGRIHSGIQIGTDVVINGRVPVDCNRFSINLCVGPTYDQDCALHFNPRLNDNRVVRNHKEGGNWGSEETDGECPFIKGHNFEIHMKAHHKGFHIIVNNRHFCEWTNRLPRETIQHIYIEGEIEIPYSDRIHSGIQIGTDVVINGRVPVACNRFSINLCVGPTYDQDCALHFNPRLDDNRVVRNHKEGGNWGSEETDGECPFIKGHNFEIHMKAHHHGYHIIVNNRRFCEWTNRLPRESIQYIYIEGEVIVSYINFIRGQPSYLPNPAGYPGQGAGFGPIYDLLVPFTTPIQEGKTTVIVSGVPHSNPSRFTVNMQCGPYDSGDFALHFDVRFNYGICRNQVVRTHKQEGKFGIEEKQLTYFPFYPNTPFQMMILIEPLSFKIKVNNQDFVEFCHRIASNRADHINIIGDVRLTEARFQ